MRLPAKLIQVSCLCNSFIQFVTQSLKYVLTSVRCVSSDHYDGDTAANNTGIVPDLMDFTFKFEEIICIIWFLKANAGTKGRWKQITRAGNVITPQTEESVVAKDTLAWRRYPREYLRGQWNPSLIPYQCHMISKSQNKESHSIKCHQSFRESPGF